MTPRFGLGAAPTLLSKGAPMKSRTRDILRTWLAALLFALGSPIATAQSFAIDTSGTSMTGLWNNPNEAGWGTAVIHQYGIMFVTMYTYDGDGSPTWYVASDCSVTANRCSGSLYRVTGGSPPTVPWNGSNRIVAPVGTLTLSFSDLNTAAMTFAINGASGSKGIRRYAFASPPTPTNPVSETCMAGHFTLAKYNAIARGMTLDQVNQTIGCRNDALLTQRDPFTVIYVWANRGGNQLILVFFDATGTFVCSDCPIFKEASGF